MILLIRKRNIISIFSALVFLSLSWGVFRMAGHPMLNKWQEEGIVICRVQTDQKAVALTFDDGPLEDTTTAVLDSLKRNQSHGTFFILGKRAEQQPDLVRRMTLEGHELGSHSYSHADYNRMSTEAQMQDIYRSAAIIEEISGKKISLFRPPGGYLSEALVSRCRQEGFTIAYWTYQQDSKDWRNGRSAAYIARFILERVEPGQIIILHDGAPNGMQTAKAVDILIPKLKDMGYKCVTLSELMAMENK